MNHISPVDVSGFEFCDESSLYKRYPVGRLEKFLLEDPITKKRYLYKHAWARTGEVLHYQVWSEVVASRLGLMLGLPMAKTSLAVSQIENLLFIQITNSGLSIGQLFPCGVLSEWFRHPKELWFSGADFLYSRNESYDIKHDKQHFLDVILEETAMIPEFETYWLRSLLFCALIGNGDFHHMNWDVLVEGNVPIRLSPLYDNGISLGFRQKEEAFSTFDHEKYFKNFKFKMRLSTDVEHMLKLPTLLTFFKNRTGELDLETETTRFLKAYDSEKLLSFLNDCVTQEVPQDYKLSQTRANFMHTFVNKRIVLMRECFEQYKQ
jgi:hypothetical protein